ncbi:serine/threonine-protein kinase unc-51-like [Gigantopelta aegis]|uniref:serine/threonine-protein kinase unc-51-like n=1 Tax=Gigantopelta aegis TaxID=1735272 RepID=UPI001B887FFB|nr:serine/threonine-protein kinase unc-51-like [Gigantopelta aegis]
MEIIGDYEYNKKDLIGHGAFAVVFKGRSRKRPNIAVAIKSITKKNIAKSQQLLSKEIKILKELSDLHHENVVGLLDCKETTNHVYLVMEYCNGGDLADYLQAKGTLSEDTISMFLKQIAEAMKALNGKGIVHRDIKPQNILLCHPGKPNASAKEIKLKIADFGFARFLQDGVMAATLCGSPMYMAPEVIMSIQYDAKADLWSIGTIVFQCLTGKAPFQAQTPQQLKHFYEKNTNLVPNIPSGTSPDLRDLLLKLLKRNAKDRIEFEDFFNHPFVLRSAHKPSSKPVPVPSRSQSFSSESSTPGKQSGPSPTPGNTDLTSSPQLKAPLAPKTDDVLDDVPPSPPDEAGFLKVDKHGLEYRPHSPTDDFVLVSESLHSDHFDGPANTGKAPMASEEEMDTFGDAPPPSLKAITVRPDVGTVTFKKDSQTSPSRPSTLQVLSPTTSTPSSQPIPVPTQVRVSPKQQPVSPSSPQNVKRIQTSPAELARVSVDKRPMPRRNSETRLSGPDLGSLSPPSVQFTIGTPPNSAGQWKRTNTPPNRPTGTPPSLSGSPHRKTSSTTSPRYSPLPFAGPGSLPPILGSPTRIPTGFDFRYSPEEQQEYLQAPFGGGHNNNLPENMATVAFTNKEVSPHEIHNMEYHRNNSDPGSLARGQSLLSQQLLRAAFANQTQGAVIQYGGNGERRGSFVNEKEKIGSLERERSSSFLKRTSSTFMESSPPTSQMYAQSPPNMEGPVTFIAPELSEDTLMNEEHNEIMGKLSFVLDLVECIMELARVRGAALSTFTDSVSCKQGESLPAEQIPRFTEAQRRLEQLVLYVRSLHLLSSSLQLARQEVKAERLQPSNSLKIVLKQMNEHYHRCVAECRQLHQRLGTTCKTPLTPQLVVSTADKLIYNYAIEMCQGAALDELFGNPHECFRRYTLAQILLHSLAQQARNQRDKDLLNKYKESVEHRLSSLHSQGIVHPYDAYS